jgi:hypothetical protein
VQAFAFIGADGESTVPGFATRFLLLKLRADFLTRRGGRPPVSGGTLNLEGDPKRPGEGDNDGLHLNGYPGRNRYSIKSAICSIGFAEHRAMSPPACDSVPAE